MKIFAAILLLMFCALIGAQTACATGWQVHGSCAAEAEDEDHCESCHWDPCNQGFHSPVKFKLDDAVAELLPVVGFDCACCSPKAAVHPALEVAPPGATTPRPAGKFPLLI